MAYNDEMCWWEFVLLSNGVMLVWCSGISGDKE